ncbi:MAG TPA: four helix bundle protein [Verrucomicrobiae bacterium]|nr:four helix bundle protein [Verrucomicrobiae bacterium]
MTYQRFEDLPVWQKAIELAEQVYDLTESDGFKCSYSLRDQIERAAISVSNNIAEGFERGTTNELLAFLYVARGSAGEVRSMLCFMERRKAFQNFRSQISNLKSTAEACSRQLRGWAASLQDSEIKGVRHLNRAALKAKEQKEKAAALQKRLLAMLPADHPLRKNASE